MTQSALILQDLRAGRVITPAGALADHGIMRLAARIRELRLEGHDIQTDTRRTGKKTYATYSLVQ